MSVLQVRRSGCGRSLQSCQNLEKEKMVFLNSYLPVTPIRLEERSLSTFISSNLLAKTVEGHFLEKMTHRVLSINNDDRLLYSIRGKRIASNGKIVVSGHTCRRVQPRRVEWIEHSPTSIGHIILGMSSRSGLVSPWAVSALKRLGR